MQVLDAAACLWCLSHCQMEYRSCTATTHCPCSASSTCFTMLSGHTVKSSCAVTRYKCKSELYAADLTLDVNSSIYPLSVSGRYTMRLSMTLLPDVSLQKDEYDAVRMHTHHRCG